MDWGSNRTLKHHGVSTVHKVANPHDRFFKEVFSRKNTAVDFLANHLPSEVLQTLDLGTMEIRKDSFIDEELRESFSDLLYEVKLADSRAYIYVLFEHKSFSDRFTAFQLLKYMIRIWELHLRQSNETSRHSATGSFREPGPGPRYLVQGTDKLTSQDFERALSNMPEGGAIMSTLAEQWFHEGKEEGKKGFWKA